MSSPSAQAFWVNAAVQILLPVLQCPDLKGKYSSMIIKSGVVIFSTGLHRKETKPFVPICIQLNITNHPEVTDSTKHTPSNMQQTQRSSLTVPISLI